MIRGGSAAILSFAMTHSFLDIPFRHPPPRSRGRAVVAWLAFAALVGNVLLPAEIKLVTWSLVLGVALLGLLVWVSNAFFAP